MTLRDLLSSRVMSKYINIETGIHEIDFTCNDVVLGFGAL
jgi:hypothetical protein